MRKKISADSDLVVAKRKIESLGYSSYGLKQGEKWLLKPNSSKTESNLPKIFKMLDVLPQDIYIVYCTNPGSKGAGVEFPISTNPIGEKNVPLSQPHSVDVASAERLGRLESENAYLRKCEIDLKEQLETALKRIAELEAEELAEGDEEPLMEDQPNNLMDALTPMIPGILERGLSMMESYFSSKRQPTQLAEAEPKIDYNKLADIVTQNIIQYQNGQQPNE